MMDLGTCQRTALSEHKKLWACSMGNCLLLIKVCDLREQVWDNIEEAHDLVQSSIEKRR